MQERHEILQPRIHSSTEPMNTQDLSRKAQISSISRIQGPVTAPSQMKENQKSEFRVIRTLHLTELLYIVEKHKKSRNYEHFQFENPKSSTLQDESKSTL